VPLKGSSRSSPSIVPVCDAPLWRTSILSHALQRDFKCAVRTRRIRPHRARPRASRHRPRAACTRMRLNIECAALRRAMFLPPRAPTSKRADLSTGANRGPSAKPPLPVFCASASPQTNVAPSLVPLNHVPSGDTSPSQPMATGCPHSRPARA